MNQTTGLHFDDKNYYLLLHSLVEKRTYRFGYRTQYGCFKTADWIIDLGPGGGRHGGQLLYEGTPEGLLKNKNSHHHKIF